MALALLRFLSSWHGNLQMIMNQAAVSISFLREAMHATRPYTSIGQTPTMWPTRIIVHLVYSKLIHHLIPDTYSTRICKETTYSTPATYPNDSPSAAVFVAWKTWMWPRIESAARQCSSPAGLNYSPSAQQPPLADTIICWSKFGCLDWKYQPSKHLYIYTSTPPNIHLSSYKSICDTI